MNLTVTMETILAICGGIVVAGGAGAVISKIVKPAMKVNERVKVLEDKADSDYATLRELAASDRVICKSLLVLLEHAITGNSVDKLKECKDNMQQHLINR